MNHHQHRMTLRPILLPLLLNMLALTSAAQDTLPDMIVLPPVHDHYYCYVRDGMAVQEVLAESRRRFPIGQPLDSAALGPCVQECNGIISMDPALRENAYTEYCLFSGTNGIIGQMIVLFVDRRQRVADLRVIGWGM